ncbi:virulence factor MviN [Dactylosporangium vinaceum]|uniref:Murein biosynthesis integral membrane protein MurJ n=1 Tax=Dactylosporangium vinaceum TaxID=53362 RepID=A0ABV5MPD4_9ACTN|nr:lipid II flippase MurJ [Dactylosporangium vinaceum]UAB94561.1 virulence factor MviN [Dactylosporangium vinaceum]
MTRSRIFGAAALVAGLTILARIAGFARILVFNSSVGTTRLGDAYQAANTIPNIIFELVAGGALASLVVPLLAGKDRAAAGRTVGALLTWVVVILTPVALLVAVFAHPLVGLLTSGQSGDVTDAGARMLRVFAPQLPLYGVGVVLTGALQTYRRFAWPVIAPLLSSLTVMGVYIAFGAVAGRGADLASVDGRELLLLSGGTTAAVAVLSLCLVAPVSRLGLGVRVATRLDVGSIATLKPLVVAGIVTVGTQQLVLGLAINLVSYSPDAGAIVVYNLAQTIFLLPWAVLAVPVATTRYPALAERGAAGDRAGFAAVLAPSVRVVVMLCSLGAAGLIVLARPIAVLLAAASSHPPAVGPLAAGIAWFAPGLLGYGLFALLSRALYAGGNAYPAAVATAIGWAAAAVAALTLATALPVADRVAAVAAANSIGMLVLGAALLVAVGRRAGREALAGAARTASTCIVAAAVATAAGLSLRSHLATPGAGGAVLQGMLCGAVVAVVFLAAVAAADRRTLLRLAGSIGGGSRS